MSDAYVFWTEELRVAGPGATADAVARLQAQLCAAGFGVRERLAGWIKGPRIRVWKTSLMGRAADVVEFEGLVRAADPGTVIEGRLRYSTPTRIQFVGLLAVGLGLLGLGAIERGVGGEGGVFGMGAIITTVALVWIYSSSRMRHEQVRFIEARLAEAVSR